MNRAPFPTFVKVSVLAMLLAALAPTARAAESTGEKYALLIGVNGYLPGHLRSLNYPEKDIEDLAEVLEMGGYQRKNIRLLTQQTGTFRADLRPASKNIRDELKRLARDCQPGDHVLVAFAGHGVQLKGDEHMFLCPEDFTRDDKERRNMIDVAEVYAALGKCKADFKLLLVDACRNDPHSRIDRSDDDEYESVTAPPVSPPPGGVVALFGCSSSEAALEDPSLGHGIFFYFVTQGLAGAACHGDSPNEVTIPDLERYVKREVRDHAWSKFKVGQNPELKSPGTRGLVPVVRFHGDHPRRQHFRKALALRVQGDPKKATREMVLAVSYDSDEAEADLKRARLMFEADRYPEAIAAYTKVLKRDPRNVRALADRGECVSSTRIRRGPSRTTMPPWKSRTTTPSSTCGLAWCRRLGR